MVFVPQFMDSAAPIRPQLLAMIAGVLICGVAVDGSYSLFAASLRRFIRGPAQRLGEPPRGRDADRRGAGSAWRGAAL